MKAGGGAKKRKLSGWPESEASNKAIEFNSILHGNSSGLEVLLLNRIAIAKSLSPPPIVYDLDWNPKPRSCNGKNAIAMLACASSYGAHIYYYPRSTRTWTTVVMMNRPTRKGDCIRWHKSGRTLATTSNYSDEKDGKVTIFSYDNKTLCFDATGSYSIKEHRNVSSLAWITGTEILVGAIFPSSWLYFFELKEGLISCVHQEECNGFPTNSPIVLQPDPNTTYFFAACEDATKILVWNKLEGSDHIWTIIRSVDCDRGICGMQFGMLTRSLITIQKGHWNVWHWVEQKDLKLQFTSLNEHKIVKGKRLKYRSELISLGVSCTGKVVASGGTGDTFLVYAMTGTAAGPPIAVHWNPACSRNSNFCYGEVRCIKFNAKEGANLQIATGGDNGFIHIWALKKTSSRSKEKVDITPDRRYEHKYYSNHLQPEKIKIPSTSDDEEDDEDVDKEVVREGPFEVVVEYVDKEVVRVAQKPKFYQIREDAEAILEIINGGYDLPKEQIKLLCEKIISADDE